jgi:hypothetical protein
MHRHPLERPEDFELNTDCQLAQGLVFAGFGRHTKTTRYHDSSLYGNHGTLTNMDPATDWVLDGTLGRFTVELAGSNQHVELANTAQPTAYTLMAFVTGFPYGSGGYSVLHRAVEVSDYERTYRFDIGPYNSIELATRAGGTSYGASCTVAGDGFYGVSGASANWHHVAVTWNGSAQFYRNGTAKATSSGSVSAIGNPVNAVHRIGLCTDNGGDFVGKLADVLVYHRALSPVEIRQLADPSNVMLSGLILPPKRRLWAVSLGGVTPAYRNLIVGGGVL